MLDPSTNRPTYLDGAQPVGGSQGKVSIPTEAMC